MKTVFYEEKDCAVYWDSENSWIYVDWRNIPSNETVKNGCEEMLKLLQQRECSKVLNDNSHVSGSWAAASDWVAQDWFPRMVSSGLKKFAWVQSPHSALSRMNAKRAENKNTEIIHYFDGGYGEATNWLKN